MTTPNPASEQGEAIAQLRQWAVAEKSSGGRCDPGRVMAYCDDAALRISALERALEESRAAHEKTVGTVLKPTSRR